MNSSLRHRGFSLVEVLAAVAIIGIITFLAIPNLIRIKEDSEKNLAIARAESLNMAMATYVQAVGQSAATTAWSGAASDEAKYTLLSPYLAFSPNTLATYIPKGYSLSFPSSLVPLSKATLTGSGNTAIAY